MYSDEDLNRAVEQGIFTPAAVASFRHHMADVRQTAAVDEENFRLIGGFNDIFVVIACLIVTYSAAWMAAEFNAVAGPLVMVACAWGLAEFFVRRRKMALPAIVLLLLFLWGVFKTCVAGVGMSNGSSLTLALAITALAAGAHWWRFHVPITVAAGMAAIVGLVFYFLLSVFPQSREWVTYIVLLGGVGTFVIAMLWDMSDRQRLTRRSDVAFWLHLLSAPLIVHPIFASLGVLSGNDSVGNVLAIVSVYVVMTVVSLVIDRRAFMVSSLAYVLYAVSTLLDTYGSVGSNLAVTGVIIGGALLLLAGFWHSARSGLVSRLPSALQQRVPVVNE
ncbi:hypothetical protein G8770_05100 [Aestuariicella hydrocarbonica]|uniref:DUF2157 domain-containing protein n=1 Tax=Pseudomaricurvus hydrocarbonicus TaxID=1470433 RepID=A0A9E5JUQ2_9GAMM|nr:hypothetical protein [Aestuariicella hydrocarbonica]NHO64916.1 hypothetical protein [Aestuariicella hydrocarbonica]